jgi:amino acid transporter
MTMLSWGILTVFVACVLGWALLMVHRRTKGKPKGGILRETVGPILVAAVCGVGITVAFQGAFGIEAGEMDETELSAILAITLLIFGIVKFAQRPNEETAEADGHETPRLRYAGNDPLVPEAREPRRGSKPVARGIIRARTGRWGGRKAA